MKTSITAIQDLYPFQSKYHVIKGYRYHYIDEGKGTPLVLVHGNPTWSFFYRRMIRDFSSNHRVIAPDHLGCGLSDKPQNFEYRLETHIENLETLLVALKVDCINLVVHDWGGAIGLGFAVRHPHRIKSLTILNSAAFSMNVMPWRIGLCRLPWFGNLAIRKLNWFVKGLLQTAVKKPLPLNVQQGYLLPYDSYENRIAVMRFVQDIPMSVNDISYEVLLEIEHGLWMFKEIPVSIIWGMQDWCFTPQFLKKWKSYFPQADVCTLENAGHLLLEDDYDQASGFLASFLKKYNL